MKVEAAEEEIVLLQFGNRAEVLDMEKAMTVDRCCLSDLLKQIAGTSS